MKRFAAGRSRRSRVFPSPKVTLPRLLARAALINTHFAHTALKLHPTVEPEGGSLQAGLVPRLGRQPLRSHRRGRHRFSHGIQARSNCQETVPHTFTLGDGPLPYATLVRDEAGNLYGTTLELGSARFAQSTILSSRYASAARPANVMDAITVTRTRRLRSSEITTEGPSHRRAQCLGPVFLSQR